MDGGGGGMMDIGGNPVVTDCSFSGNWTEYGGAMATWSSIATVTNCAFSNNTAEYGGGMRNLNSQATVTNCTFSGNSAQEGGAIHNHDGASTTVNCIFWGNSPDEVFGPAEISYSRVEGGWPGPGNIDADPLFVDPANGDLRLSPDSPCIDAGNNTAVPDGITTDLEGNPRFLDIPETPDTGNGDPPIVDMGAYESLGAGCLAITGQEVICHGDGSTFTVNIEGVSPCTGDTVMATFTGSGGAVGEDFCTTLIINTDQGGFCCSTQLCVPVPDCAASAVLCGLDGDGEVGVTDVLALLAAWGACPDCGNCIADLDGDCTVGVNDFLTLLAAWGPCP
jgi:hypothetical protein